MSGCPTTPATAVTRPPREGPMLRQRRPENRFGSTVELAPDARVRSKPKIARNGFMILSASFLSQCIRGVHLPAALAALLSLWERRCRYAASNGTVNCSAQVFEAIYPLGAQESDRECGLVVIERLIEIRINAAGFAVRRAGYRRKFRKHDASSLLRRKTDRSFDVLTFRIRMPDDDVGADETSA